MTSRLAELRGAVLADLEAGATLEQAARNSQLRLGTLKHWLWRGRREEAGQHFEFAAAVERAREVAASREQPGTREELVSRCGGR